MIVKHSQVTPEINSKLGWGRVETTRLSDAGALGLRRFVWNATTTLPKWRRARTRAPLLRTACRQKVLHDKPLPRVWRRFAASRPSPSGGHWPALTRRIAGLSLVAGRADPQERVQFGMLRSTRNDERPARSPSLEPRSRFFCLAPRLPFGIGMSMSTSSCSSSAVRSRSPRTTGITYLLAGDCACWPAGVANGHTVSNRSSSPCSYLIVGTRDRDQSGHYVHDPDVPVPAA